MHLKEKRRPKSNVAVEQSMCIILLLPLPLLILWWGNWASFHPQGSHRLILRWGQFRRWAYRTAAKLSVGGGEDGRKNTASEAARLNGRLGGAGNKLLPLLIGPCLAMSSGFQFWYRRKNELDAFRFSTLSFILEEAEHDPTGFGAKVSSS